MYQAQPAAGREAVGGIFTGVFLSAGVLDKQPARIAERSVFQESVKSWKDDRQPGKAFLVNDALDASGPNRAALRDHGGLIRSDAKQPVNRGFALELQSFDGNRLDAFGTQPAPGIDGRMFHRPFGQNFTDRSEEHTSELQSHSFI